jgi:peptidylprolyl isomerase
MRPSALTLLATLALGACSSGTQPTPDVPAVDGATPDAAGADAAGADAAGGYYAPTGYTLTPFLSTDPQREFTAADMVLQPGRDYLAVIETDNAGRFVLDLLEDQTPITVNSFVFLARHHYFDGIAFHRVIEGFVAQGGDPNTLTTDTSSWGSGGPGYEFGLEIVSGLTYDGAGVVGMARTPDPNTNGSQFFITLAATHNLDGMYTIFARLSEGMDNLARITRGQPPATPTRMARVYVVERAR